MKKAILIFGFVVCSAAVMTQVCANPLPAFVTSIRNAAFNWAQTLFDFGSIKQNAPVSHTFKFKNQGDAPLVISSVQASCGCTVTDYSKTPIEAGGEGYVKATYNAATLGAFNKTVTVNANTDDGVVLLTIKGTVVE
jgi:hypothetical protein